MKSTLPGTGTNPLRWKNRTSHQEITLESLQQANLLSNLFSQYDSVVYTEDYPDGYGDTTYIIETDTGYALWYGNTMNGYYNEFIFFADGDEPDRMTAWPFGIMPEWLDDFVGDGLLPTEDDELIFQESGGGETVFYIEDADYDDVDIVYTVDSETLVLKTIERMNDNDESLSITTFHYGEEVELPERITAWQGVLTITARGAQPISTKPAPSRMNIRETEPISRFMFVAKRNETVLLKKFDPVQQKQGILPIGK